MLTSSLMCQPRLEIDLELRWPLLVPLCGSEILRLLEPHTHMCPGRGPPLMLMSACCDLCFAREGAHCWLDVPIRPGDRLEATLAPIDTPLRLWNIQTLWSPRRTCAQAGAPLLLVIPA